MPRKPQQTAYPGVQSVSVGTGGVRKREPGDPAPSEAEVAYLARHKIEVEPSDADLWAFVLPDVSVVIQLDSDWLAEVTVVSQDGAPVVGAVEVRPHSGVTPRGGLSARLMRRLRLEDALSAARLALRGVESEVLGLHGFDRPHLDDAPGRARRQSRPDSFYAMVAARYCEAIAHRSSAPRREVAAWLGDGYSEAFVRDAVRVARDRGLLTPATHGVARGTLTAKGRAALSAA